MFDSEDNPERDAKPSDLDLIKIDELDIDGVMHAESRLWSIMRYPKYYCLVFNTKEHGFKMIDCGSKQNVFDILNAL